MRRRARAVAATLAGTVTLVVAAHLVVRVASRLDPPALGPPPALDVVEDGGGETRTLGRSSVTRGAILEVSLAGTAEEIGHAHGRLLRPEMVETERVVWDLFRTHVPNALFRVALTDLALLRYRSLDTGMDPARLMEIAAQARAFSPDVFANELPTYQRFVYLTALYDIALSFETSPLIGCTSFFFAGEAAGGDVILSRAFDFEAHDVFDEKKAVFLVEETGMIPFASVAWPGLVGVVSGMNVEGVAAVVHGARAGEPESRGEPVVHALRRVLSRARSADEGVRLLSESRPMVSHVVIVADASGAAYSVERVPGHPAHPRRLGTRAAVTNHLEGPHASDPKNERVRRTTSTLARRRRADELLAEQKGRMDAAAAVALLRDRRGAQGAALPLGSRDAIDALIATHGVVMSLRERILWVSEAPHLLGRFVPFDLQVAFRGSTARPPPPIPADPLAATDWRSQRGDARSTR